MARRIRLRHAALLYFGDFLGAYGLIGIVATLALLGRGERVQRIVLWLWALTLLEAIVLAAVAVFQIATGPDLSANQAMHPVASLVAPTYVSSLRARLAEWPAHTATVLGAIVIVWLGMWAAGRRLLEDPLTHRRLLERVATGSLGIAFLGGLPLGLTSAGILHVNASALSTIFLLHQVSGMFGGPGYIALAALVSIRAAPLPPAALTARAIRLVAALGQRSLSGYLFQSLAWVLLLAPYGLALSRRAASPLLTGILLAIAVWIVSVAVAGLLQRHGRRGPAEAPLRHLVYRKGTTDFRTYSIVR